MPAGGNEAIQGSCKMLAGLLLASGQHFHIWELAITRVKCGWIMYLHIYNFVPSNSLIYDY